MWVSCDLIEFGAGSKVCDAYVSMKLLIGVRI